MSGVLISFGSGKKKSMGCHVQYFRALSIHCFKHFFSGHCAAIGFDGNTRLGEEFCQCKNLLRGSRQWFPFTSAEIPVSEAYNSNPEILLSLAKGGLFDVEAHNHDLEAL